MINTKHPYQLALYISTQPTPQQLKTRLVAVVTLASSATLPAMYPLFNDAWDQLAHRKKDNMLWDIIRAVQRKEPHILYSLAIIDPTGEETYPPNKFNLETDND